MGTWIIEVEGNCADPGQLKEFHEWYNNTHVPDVLSTPGFVKAVRYELAEPQEDKGQFLAVYEIEGDSLEDVLMRHNANMKKKLEEGRFSKLLTLKSRGVYRKIGDFLPEKK